MTNRSNTSSHLADLGLIQFADGEMPGKLLAVTESHLRICQTCRIRLEQLRRGAEAYGEYHSELLRPALEDIQNWSSLEARLENPGGSRHRIPLPTKWWAAAALACSALALGWFLYRETPAQQMQQVLSRAAETPAPEHRRLKVSASGHSWYRAGMVDGNTIERLSTARQDTRALFRKANYSWDDPLSARSFSAWRKQLSKKRDQVLLIGEGGQRYYRLETETSTGLLRTAALTLRANTLVAVRGVFQFEDEVDVSIEDAGGMPTAAAKREPQKASPVERAAVVKQVGPEEELRVLAALDRIGADVGEQVTVEIEASKRQISVAGLGLSSARERQIREALRQVPAAAVRFVSSEPKGAANQPADSAVSSADKIPADKSAPLRPRLEAQAGGPGRYQAITDGALDASSNVLAQAHALYVLARKFPPAVAGRFGPPERAILIRLRRHHATAIERATADLADALKPLIGLPINTVNETPSQGNTSWDISAAQLYEQAKSIDASLGRILGGSYSREAGEDILDELPHQIQRLEVLAQSQKSLR